MDFLGGGSVFGGGGASSPQQGKILICLPLNMVYFSFSSILTRFVYKLLYCEEKNIGGQSFMIP